MSGHRFASLIQELPPVDGVIRQSSAVEKKGGGIGGRIQEHSRMHR